MKIKRITIVLVALCAFSGAAVGGAASVPVSAPDTQAAAGGSAAANTSAGQVSDCDLVDIDGHNNTVSANITNNATAGDGGVTIQYRCGTNASALDHDLIDVDGNNNTVTVFVRAENATLDFGARGSAADSNGLHVGLNCGVGTPDDCDGVDIDGDNNSVTLIVQNDTDRTVHEFGANSSNVSWTAGEQDSESDANGGNDSTTDKQADSENDGSGSADATNRSGNEEDRSNGILGLIVDSIPFVGAVTLLVFGSVLLVKRNNG
jgi:hypothetical protein